MTILSDPKKPSLMVVPSLEAASALSPTQIHAIELIVSGKSVTETASLIDRSRSVMYLWQKDPHFVAELNRQRNDLHNSAQSRLLALSRAALDVVEQRLAQGDLRAALGLLKLSGLQADETEYPLPTDPHLIVKAQAEDIALRNFYDQPFSQAPQRYMVSNACVKGVAEDIAGLISECYNVHHGELLDIVALSDSNDKALAEVPAQRATVK